MFEKSFFKTIKNWKNKATCIAVLTLLLTATLFAISPAATAQTATNVPTAGYISAYPNPCGVGQTLVISFWVEPIPPTRTDIFHGFNLKITAPDGTVQTKGPLNSQPIGTVFTSIIPTKAGKWQFDFTYSGETIRTFQYQPCQASTTAIVQEQPATGPSGVPLPTGYWTRPAYGANREWGAITGDWLMRAYNASQRPWDSAVGFNPYSTAPRSPHVMWTKPLAIGGIAGGTQGDVSFYGGSSYEPLLTPPVVMGGRLYYNLYQGGTSGAYPSFPGFVCVDLRTGEQLFVNPDYAITCASELNYYTPNQAGVIPYLWGINATNYSVFNTQTGKLMISFANATSGTLNYGSNGELLSYVLNPTAGWLALWNQTKAFEQTGQVTPSIPNDYSYGQLRPIPGTYNWLKGIQWNTTITPHPQTTPAGPDTPYTLSITGITGNVILARYGATGNYMFDIGYSVTTGQELWAINRTINGPTAYETYFSLGNGVFGQFNVATGKWIGFDINTGQQIWESDPQVPPWGLFQGGVSTTTAYGMFYSLSYDGYIHAFSETTGKEVWKFYSGDAGLDTPYGTYPMYYGPIVADGVVFAGTGEHSLTQPLIRGEKLFAVDALTGKGLWNMSGIQALSGIADGYLVSYNIGDNQIYVFGKGPSATTVQAPLTAVVKGTAITIAGTVTDQSAGQKGTPAISDADMGVYMAYLKEQQPLDLTKIHGVSVNIVAVAPDGTETQVGDVTSDSYGNFFCSWVPQGTGLYRIVAQFAGTDSYGSSSAETAVTVVSAAPSASASAAPTPTNAPPTQIPTGTSSSPSPVTPPTGGQETAIYVVIAAVAVIIVVIAAAIALRRRK
jgi:hypothetical protein